LPASALMPLISALISPASALISLISALI
jgi:hypothetical protein